jgi:SAM-dependent methyltransferase
MIGRIPGSFRDPAGFVFEHEGRLHRWVAAAHAEDFDRFVGSGLYDELVRDGRLVGHEEVDLPVDGPPPHRILRPELVEFVSYPYEWCFSELKEAALLTLRIARAALAKDMVLRDASAYNVQFRGTKPVFIDTLSFGRYEEGVPWVAYRQFCQHFLAPLAVAALKDVRLLPHLRNHIDGLPLDLAARLLPTAARLRPGLLVHLFLHAGFQERFSETSPDTKGARRASNARVTRAGLQGLLESLESAVEGIAWDPKGTEWADYYDRTNYSDDAMRHKEELVDRLLEKSGAATVWDLGANTGRFARIAAAGGRRCVAFDVDPAAVERGFLESRAKGDGRVLHLHQDLTSPSPSLGWANEERRSLEDRGPADAVLALGLVHHLAIGNNVPLGYVARYLARLGRSLVVEFIPKSDSQVKRLLSCREDVFPQYDPEGFERAFCEAFVICDREPIRGAERVLYRMERRRA